MLIHFHCFSHLRRIPNSVYKIYRIVPTMYCINKKSEIQVKKPAWGHILHLAEFNRCSLVLCYTASCRRNNLRKVNILFPVASDIETLYSEHVPCFIHCILSVNELSVQTGIAARLEIGWNGYNHVSLNSP